MLELYYNFFTKFCDVNKFEVLELDTDSLYLAFAEKVLEYCIRPEMRAERQRFWSNDCVDSFTADAAASFFPRTCCLKHKQHDKREPGLFKEEFICTEMLCLCSKTYCCYDVTSNKLNFSRKDLTNVSWNRVATDHWKSNVEQTMTVLLPGNKLRKVCSTFIQKKRVERDEIHTQPPNL